MVAMGVVGLIVLADGTQRAHAKGLGGATGSPYRSTLVAEQSCWTTGVGREGLHATPSHPTPTVVGPARSGELILMGRRGGAAGATWGRQGEVGEVVCSPL